LLSCKKILRANQSESYTNAGRSTSIPSFSWQHLQEYVEYFQGDGAEFISNILMGGFLHLLTNN